MIEFTCPGCLNQSRIANAAFSGMRARCVVCRGVHPYPRPNWRNRSPRRPILAQPLLPPRKGPGGTCSPPDPRCGPRSDNRLVVRVRRKTRLLTRMPSAFETEDHELETPPIAACFRFDPDAPRRPGWGRPEHRRRGRTGGRGNRRARNRKSPRKRSPCGKSRRSAEPNSTASCRGRITHPKKKGNRPKNRDCRRATGRSSSTAARSRLPHRRAGDRVRRGREEDRRIEEPPASPPPEPIKIVEKPKEKPKELPKLQESPPPRHGGEPIRFNAPQLIAERNANPDGFDRAFHAQPILVRGTYARMANGVLYLAENPNDAGIACVPPVLSLKGTTAKPVPSFVLLDLTLPLNELT